jgi:hypothetical protein
MISWGHAQAWRRDLEADGFTTRFQAKFFWRFSDAADSNRAANLGTGAFGTSPIFVRLSDKPLLVRIRVCGVPKRKHNGGSGKFRVTAR